MDEYVCVMHHSLFWKMCDAESKAGFTSECEQNTNAACENKVIVWCRCVTEARQAVFGCATNVWQTAKHYLSTVGTSKGICIQYVYNGYIRCHGKCRTVYKYVQMYHTFCLTLLQHASFAFRCKPGLRCDEKVVKRQCQWWSCSCL